MWISSFNITFSPLHLSLKDNNNTTDLINFLLLFYVYLWLQDWCCIDTELFLFSSITIFSKFSSLYFFPVYPAKEEREHYL